MRSSGASQPPILGPKMFFSRLHLATECFSWDLICARFLEFFFQPYDNVNTLCTTTFGEFLINMLPFHLPSHYHLENVKLPSSR